MKVVRGWWQNKWWLLAAFAKLRKATISFIMSVRIKKLGSHCTDFYEMWYLSIFRNYAEKIKVSLKSKKNSGTLHAEYIFLIMSRSVLLRMRKFQTNIVQKFQTNILCTIIWKKNRAFYEIMWEKLYSRAGHRWQLLYIACALLAGHLRLQTHTVVLLFHCNSGCTNAPYSYSDIIQTLTVLMPLWT